MIFNPQPHRGEMGWLWIRNLVELWGSVGHSQRHLLHDGLLTDSGFQNQRRCLGGEQRTGCPFSRDRDQLDVTASLCVYLSGCAWYSHDVECFLPSNCKKHRGIRFEVFIDEFCVFPEVFFLLLSRSFQTTLFSVLCRKGKFKMA